MKEQEHTDEEMAEAMKRQGMTEEQIAAQLAVGQCQECGREMRHYQLSEYELCPECEKKSAFQARIDGGMRQVPRLKRQQYKTRLI